MKFQATLCFCLRLALALPVTMDAAGGLYFREDFTTAPPATPITREHVANDQLMLHLYGPARDQVKKSHHEEKQDDPFYVWSGQCTGHWAVAFTRNGAPANLSGKEACFRACTENFDRTLYVAIETPDGWMVSGRGFGPSKDWRIATLRVAGLNWDKLDIQSVQRGEPVSHPRLDRVQQIGFTDLQDGNQSAQCSRLDWLEVWEDLPASPLYAVRAEEGWQVYERDQPVLFYRTLAKTMDDAFSRADYVHPLWGPRGEVLTEDFPADHPHHRGIFWSWHQVWIGDRKIGDGWACTNFVWDVRHVQVRADSPDLVVLVADVDWRSPEWRGGREAFVRETTTIRAHALEHDRRAVDFAISLRALLPGVRLGGSDDVKGYGGFTARIPSPPDMKFTSQQGPVTPRNTSVPGGAWMNLTGIRNGHAYAVEIMQHPDDPGFPEEWILRDDPRPTNMQNAKWPGRTPVPLPTNHPLVLRYRLLLHEDTDPAGAYEAYVNEVQQP